MAQQLITHVPPLLRQQNEVSLPSVAAHAHTLSVVVAAGPFTTSDNFHYEPLEELLKYCSGEPMSPEGWLSPFQATSLTHSTIQPTMSARLCSWDPLSIRTTPQSRMGASMSHLTNCSRTRCWRRIGHDAQVLAKLQSWLLAPENSARRVVLMPATRDAFAPPVFPQPPIPVQGLPLTATAEPASGPRLRSFQNPCLLEMGLSAVETSSSPAAAMRIAACSQDVLLHLSAGEVSRGSAAGQDRLAALASHVIGQQR